MSISGRPEIEGAVSKHEGEEKYAKRGSSSFETRAAHAPQDEAPFTRSPRTKDRSFWKRAAFSAKMRAFREQEIPSAPA
jgi:hypothetical protein